ncbi:nitrous oxide reductase family maturation protein NosD [Methanococcoides sp. AM1]|uniref:right-handed parallel beta-helix repeat-containing protein n=1 Tax=Methanococcoides sp. AM1 TaxID=1201011 RepID=UPI001083186B|nr:NosD domain-containing protein [Methanococcoides sp. AM1]
MNVNRTFGLLLMVAIVAVTALATPALADIGLTSDRSISVTEAAPGDTFTVTVSMECTDFTSTDHLTAMAVTEILPSGWIFTEVDSTGYGSPTVIGDSYTWQAVAQEMVPGDIVTFVYDVTIPAGESGGVQSISGTSSAWTFDSEVYLSGTTLGDTDVNVLHNPIISISPGDSLQAAVDAAQDGDTIMMAPGAYDLDVNSIGMGVLSIAKPNLTFMADGGEVIIAPTGGMPSIFIGLDPADDFSAFPIYDASGTSFVGITFDDGLAISCPESIGDSNSAYAYSDALYDGCSFNLPAGDFETLCLADNSVVRNSTFGAYTKLVLTGNDVTIEDNSGNGNIRGDSSNLILRGNTLDNVYIVNQGGNLLIENNVFEGTSGNINAYNSGSNIIRYNEFRNATSAIKFNGQVYLNNFINCDGISAYNNGVPAVCNTSTPVTYSYRGTTYTGYLGNYYSDYAGEDSNGDGVGEDWYLISDIPPVNDTYPLMGAWNAENSEVESSLVLMSYEVTLDKYGKIDPSSVDPAAGTSWDSSTDLAALMETGLDIDASYSPASDPYPASFWINDIGAVGGTGWGILINGIPADNGLGANYLNDGDVVEFYAPLWTQDETGTWVAGADGANYGVCINVNMNENTPVIATRDIMYQTFMQDSFLEAEGVTQHNATLVTITMEAVGDIEALTLKENVPEGWILTPSDNNGSSFREYPDAADTYEWVWADNMTDGEEVTISYIVQIPYDEPMADYTFTGLVSAFALGADVDDIPVGGDASIAISDDWNPWDDVDSVADENVVTSELQQAINCWLTDAPAPVTEAQITTDRLQFVITQWLDSPE